MTRRQQIYLCISILWAIIIFSGIVLLIPPEFYDSRTPVWVKKLVPLVNIVIGFLPFFLVFWISSLKKRLVAKKTTTAV